MEKRYFVLRKGYLNINEEFFYFSDHGNWETCEILEETENPKLTFSYIFDHILYVTVALAILTIIMYFLTGKLEIIYSGLLIGSVIHLFQRRYKISQFKIPVHKIERIHVVSDTVDITFSNSKNEQVVHTLQLDDTVETEDLKSYLKAYFNQKIYVS
ncbi:hypothetical protein [uncultured Kordia sp.]|uniref:hypothetical protein n=1 Tax=uncultured Kordia sp. TaxID=507699 RepID=UPI00261E9A91|nr:hypothetical protein [uncultured Kordia sp.]